MGLILPILLFLLGFVLLILGGDWFVDGAVAIAKKWHIPDLLIGATVVSIGTTLPEVMVSAGAAVAGHSEIAYGNALGSIICNTALISAITITFAPGLTDKKSLRVPAAFFFVALAAYAGVSYSFNFMPELFVYADRGGKVGNFGVAAVQDFAHFGRGADGLDMV